MSDIVRGTDATLISEFHAYPGGPAIDVINLTLKVVHAGSGNVVLGPISTGFGHPATGIYTYVWSVPDVVVAGDYVVIWDATDVALTPVQATEIVTIVSGSSFESGPCEPWEPIWCAPLPTGAEAVTGDAVQMATEVLFQAGGQRFGICHVKIRPCRDDCAGAWMGFNEWWPGVGGVVTSNGGGPRPWWVNGTWYNVCSVGCGGTCSCTVIDQALLPAPTREVIEVKLNGQVMDPSLYRVDENRLLVRLDGQLWPLCQDLAASDDEDGTWSVTIAVGEDVPVLAKRALGELAMEFVKECLGEDCLIPYEVTSLSRQGVNITFGSPSATRTIVGEMGLRMVDLYLATYNPSNLQRKGKTYDIDRNPRPWRRVDTS